MLYCYFLLIGQFKLYFLDCHYKKLVAINVGRTRFSGLQDSDAKTKRESLDVFSGQFCLAVLGPFLVSWHFFIATRTNKFVSRNFALYSSSSLYISLYFDISI